MPTMLVSGGFIGSNFIHIALQNPAIRLINLDKLTYAGNLDSLQDIEQDSRYIFMQGDINHRPRGFSVVTIFVT